MDGLWQDLRQAFRAARRNPGFAAAVILTIALGVGANVTMFSVVDSLLFRVPGHIQNSGDLMRVRWLHKEHNQDSSNCKFPEFQAVQRNSRLLDLAGETASLLDYGRGAESLEIHASYVTANYFRVLGVEPYAGRFFSAAEDDPNAPEPVAILSYDFWEKHLGGDAKVLGHEVWIGNQNYAVIGILPRGFTGTGFTITDAWLPLGEARSWVDGELQMKSTNNAWISTFGRVTGKAGAAEAQTEASSVIGHSGVEDVTGVALKPYFSGRTDRLSASARMSVWLAGTALVVFLIACANVANLFLVRVVQRRHEMAVRLHCGAGRWALIRKVLCESFLLNAAGGAAALLIVYWLRPVTRAFLFTPRFYEGTFFNWRMLLMAGAFTTLAALVSGVVPAVRASRASVIESLKSGGQGHLQDRSRLRSGLLAVQVGLTVILTVGAGLFLRSLRSVQGINSGIDVDRILVASMNLAQAGFKGPDINAAYARLMERVRTVPGVAGAATSKMLPFYSMTITGFHPAGDGKSPQRTTSATTNSVSPDYFRAMGIITLAGRTFLETDRAGSEPVAILNDSAARKMWPGKNPVGQCVSRSDEKACRVVVGVVGDARTYRLIEDQNTPKEEVYIPITQDDMKWTVTSALAIRAEGSPARLMKDIYPVLAAAAPDGQYVKLEPLSDAMDGQTKDWRLGASMFGLFSGLALAVAAVGIYGVLAFLVRQRTSEIGIRMALGAQRENILQLIMWQGLRIVVIGLVLGLGSALGLSRLVQSLLYGVKGSDAWSYAAASIVLTIVAVSACWIPARRAMRVDPMVALRYE